MEQAAWERGQLGFMRMEDRITHARTAAPICMHAPGSVFPFVRTIHRPRPLSELELPPPLSEGGSA